MPRQRRSYYFRFLELLLILAWSTALASAAASSSSSSNNRGSNSRRGRNRHGTGGDHNDHDEGYGSDYDDYSDSEDGWVAGWYVPAAGAGGNRPYSIVEKALDLRKVHGILASVAMVVLFPLGGLLVRVWTPSSKSGGARRVHGFHAHVVVQALGWMVFVAAAGIGIWLVTVVKIPGGGLLGNPATRYHPIIGIILFVLLGALQTIFGLLHHRAFKRLQRRQAWSYAHLAVGRLGVTLGIINGGLGLHVSRAETRWVVAYSVVAGVIWVVWMALAVVGELKRRKRVTGESEVEDKPPQYA
ncbi:hypothetical protein VTJ49DRAFT_4404 [Mycothermus thermophilus]|uniref:Cytochrome b561 domain-containing protein n=1 Tax=Humicola insolens TaxID=85995 RepID=A0ABR3V6F2_HUMIN